MQRRTFLLAAAAQVAIAASVRADAEPAPIGAALPVLPTDGRDWLNSAPLVPAALADRPVLVEFWTFECSNCRNTLPWMKAAAARYAPRGLAVVAVHTPEFASERDPAAVRVALTRLGIDYPVLLDADSRVWNAFGNRYWPAFYLYDRAHRLIDTRIGELHAGEARADAFEARIVSALAR